MAGAAIFAILVGTGLALVLIGLPGPLQGALPGPARGARLPRPASAERLAAERAPAPIWLTSATGNLLWANASYRRLAARIGAERVFPDPVPEDRRAVRRIRLEPKGPATPGWFDVQTRATRGGALHYAQDAGPLVAAETARATFVQTLGKTFASLPTGLAIFDRDRQLALFNPALLDLTRLSAPFLSARPTLVTFFDQLRESRVMPEPKSYSDWRAHLADLVEAAKEDRYTETWSLPDETTYRITGRAHPDGAIAFLFEDISSEIALTRRFREELTLNHAVIEALGDAIAVFDAGGICIFSNASYRRLWLFDAGAQIREATLAEALAEWRAKSAPGEGWSEVASALEARDRGEAWQGVAPGPSGHLLAVACAPLAGGALLVRFSRGPGRGAG
ncbi:PAS-domain containing protein [Roseivivax sp.]